MRLWLIRVFSPLLDHSFSIHLLRKVHCEAVRKWYSLLRRDDNQGVYSLPRLVRIAAYTHYRSRPDRRPQSKVLSGVIQRKCIGNPTNTAGKKMGLPRLIGKTLNARTIYLYRTDSMAGLVLWIPVFTGKTIPGVFGQPH
jgi:hypothetical protein